MILFYLLLPLEIDLLVMINFDLVRNNIGNFISERKKIKNLDYFYFKDTKKQIDISHRVSQAFILSCFIFGFILTIISHLGIFSYLSHFKFTQLFLSIIIVFCVALYFMLLMLIGLSLPISFYISTWIVALFLINFLYSLHILNNSIYFLIFFVISLFLELIWSIFLPKHILRILDTKTLWISTLITVLSTLLIQSSQLLFHLTYPHYQSISKAIIESWRSKTELDQKIIDTVKNNSNIIDNLFVQYQTSNYISSLQLWSSILAITILLGILFTTIRISRNTSKTRNILYAYLLDNKSDKKITYTKLKKLAYDGGNSIEDLIISQPNLLEIIITNEKDIEIPNSLTSKEKITNFIHSKL